MSVGPTPPQPGPDPATPPADRVRDAGPLSACPHCGCRDLFVRKDFPQKLGLAVVVVAGVAFLILAANRATFAVGAWILVAAAAVDALLYLFVRKVTVCYRCRAEFRHAAPDPRHRGFELATAEKYRGAG